MSCWWKINQFVCIEDFEELGRYGKTSSTANHGLVFMLRGLCKKWKHSVAYYLIHRSTMGEMLVAFFMEVFDVYRNAGLIVAVTMFSMIANNVMPWSSWLFLKRQLSSGFVIKKLQQHLILLFCWNARATCSLNMMCRRLGLRMWTTYWYSWVEEILKVYEIEKENVLYHLLTNVTDNWILLHSVPWKSA